MRSLLRTFRKTSCVGDHKQTPQPKYFCNYYYYLPFILAFYLAHCKWQCFMLVKSTCFVIFFCALWFTWTANIGLHPNGFKRTCSKKSVAAPHCHPYQLMVSHDRHYSPSMPAQAIRRLFCRAGWFSSLDTENLVQPGDGKGM